MENKPSSRVPLWTLYLMGEKALRCWLSSKLGKRWLEQRSYRVVGKWKNVLARAAIEHGEERAIETRHKLTAKQIREQENRLQLADSEIQETQFAGRKNFDGQVVVSVVW